MVLSAQPVERYSKSGLYLGLGYSVPAVPGVQRRVITRIVRGLYWHHIGSRVPDDANIELVFIDTQTRLGRRPYSPSPIDAAPHPHW
jgi:hypothetical protein